MASYKYFWDLAKSTLYETHTVGSFDNNTNTGGGIFRWIGNVNNTSVNNVAGFRIKPTATTNGYWERVYDGPVNVGWFGTQNPAGVAPLSFAAQGVSQAVLNNRYGVGFASTSDNYDTTAIRYAFYVMNTLGFQSLIFEPKKYWINRQCDLPVNLPALPTYRGQFVIDGNGAVLVKASQDQFDWFYRRPTDQVAATGSYLNTTFIIKNFNAVGSGGFWTSSGYAFINLGATTGSVIENITLQSFDIGIKLEYCVNARISNIQTNNIKTYSIIVRNGSWTGAGLSNASSHGCIISNINIYDTINQYAGVAVWGANMAHIEDVTIDGTGTPLAGIEWRDLSNPQATHVTIKRVYLNKDTLNGGILILPTLLTNVLPELKGMHIVDTVYVRIPMIVLTCFANSGFTNSYIRFLNTGTWPVGSQLINYSNLTWDIDNVRFGSTILTANDVVTDPTLWNTTNVTYPGSPPILADLRYTPPVKP
jgi:hypothetical protein